MPLVIRELHAAPTTGALNEEWFVIENTGTGELHTAGVTIAVSQRGKRPRNLGTLSPGFALRPGERVRLITGSAAKKSQGAPPAEEDGMRNYHLFLQEPVLARSGELMLLLKQFELCRTTIAAGGAGKA